MPRPRRYATKTVLLAASALAVGLAAALIAVSLADRPQGTNTPAAPQGLLAGIPQHGAALGRPSAPVTLVESADFQCPFCAQFDLKTLPVLVDEYVRQGTLRIVLRPIAFIGPDSALGARAALAAGLQNRFWDLAQLLFANQAQENTGWLSNDRIRVLAARIPGLDLERFQRGVDSSRVSELADHAANDAATIGLNSTPSFEIGATKGPLSFPEVQSLEPSAFRPVIERLAGGRSAPPPPEANRSGGR
jgi:protein-disulfide isomerase